jgi:hypothetical protein
MLAPKAIRSVSLACGALEAVDDDDEQAETTSMPATMGTSQRRCATARG